MSTRSVLIDEVDKDGIHAVAAEVRLVGATTDALGTPFIYVLRRVEMYLEYEMGVKYYREMTMIRPSEWADAKKRAAAWDHLYFELRKSIFSSMYKTHTRGGGRIN